MKHSQSIGIIAALALIGVCFLPWSYIPGLQATLTGMNTGVTHFGRPGLLTMVLAALSAVLFLIPKIWAKRTNVVISAVGISWAVRNFLLLSACLMGDCPEKRAGLYLILLLSFVVLLMSFFPKLDVNKKED
ncbi:hypothetical protein SAMN05421788_10737 [Filimonas lacunae]|uniref:Transmembrane protein n=1 Tax=Filimonas lacunae TaxID=477680 RepID=A0A1N7QV13_9BACT|nr:hypothetical protein [Filimonas lacunae]SIT26713.1 hypothetical protein SAMN05421788_10737 [Filimonas lacunae]